MLHLLDLVEQAKAAIEQTQDIKTLNSVRIEYLGKRGLFTQKITVLRNLTKEIRAEEGAVINQAKKNIQRAINERKIVLKRLALEAQLATEKIDISLPGRRIKNGGLHPVSHTIIRIERFFSKLGFSVVTGPEIEDDYHNFDALNIPAYHPSRTDYDTFWIDANRLLRTQTSSVQIHTMKVQKPPIRIITSGRVYRNDYDKTHTPMFHQMEGLVIDKNISFANLKNILHDFLNNFFEEDLQLRFRPSYFPFTEPSAEVDIIGKNNRWLEVLGCGMVHPSVLRNVGINPETYSGFAFGIGIERLTMLRYGVADLRIFFENDLRFLKQFK